MRSGVWAACFLITACAGMPNPAGLQTAAVTAQQAGKLPFTLLEKGCFSAVTKEGGRVVRSTGELKAFLAEFKGYNPVLPAVDFEEETVVFVFAGNLPTAGYELELMGVEEGLQEVVVKAVVVSPSPGRSVAQVIISPYAVIKLPVTGKPVRFDITHQDPSAPGGKELKASG